MQVTPQFHEGRKRPDDIAKIGWQLMAEIQSSSFLKMPQRRHAVASLQVAVEITETDRYVDSLFVGHID